MAEKEFSICMWTTKKNKMLLEVCIFQNVNAKNVFTFHPKNFIVSTSLEICKASCHMPKIPIKEQKVIVILFSVNRTCCFAEKLSRENEQLKNYLLC